MGEEQVAEIAGGLGVDREELKAALASPTTLELKGLLR